MELAKLRRERARSLEGRREGGGSGRRGNVTSTAGRARPIQDEEETERSLEGRREGGGSGRRGNVTSAAGRARPIQDEEETERSLKSGKKKGQVVVVGASILDFTARMRNRNFVVSHFWGANLINNSVIDALFGCCCFADSSVSDTEL